MLMHNMLDNPLDPDKLDYIVRDARRSGVPYGNIDTMRLLRSTRLSEDGMHIAITDKGIAPVESLVFSQYMMYRNVYWHHAVCIANAMMVRAVQDAIEDYGVNPGILARLRESQLIEKLKRTGDGSSSPAELVGRLEARQLYERAVVFQPGSYRRGRVGMYEENPQTRKQKEKELCERFSHLVPSALKNYDILVHIPFLDRAPRFDVEVYFRRPPHGRRNPLPFDSGEVSLLGPALLHNFENQTKKIRLVCIRQSCRGPSGELHTLAEVLRERVRRRPEESDIV
jgi:HD superfamily phosphohydrolase